MGFSQLPVAGGYLDQPYRLMTFFEIFLSAERKAAYQLLNA